MWIAVRFFLLKKRKILLIKKMPLEGKVAQSTLKRYG
jgi:hypothetical protein